MNKITKIYLVENCYGDPNKIYIGKTKNSRKRAHESKLGINIKYTIIDEINSLDVVDWKPLESYWIEQFRNWGFDVLNKNEGGGGPIFQTQEAKMKYKQWRKGKKPMLGKKQSVLTRKRKSQALKGKPKPEGFGEMMRYVRQGVPKPKGMGDKVSKNRNHKAAALKQQKKVIQLDLDGNIIKEWDSINIAAEGTNSNPSTISKVCRGIFNQTNGFKWKFKK